MASRRQRRGRRRCARQTAGRSPALEDGSADGECGDGGGGEDGDAGRAVAAEDVLDGGLEVRGLAVARIQRKQLLKRSAARTHPHERTRNQPRQGLEQCWAQEHSS